MPKEEAVSKSKRALAIDMLLLFENSIEQKSEWSDLEKSLRCKILIHSTTNLLASFVKFHTDSVRNWLRTSIIKKQLYMLLKFGLNLGNLALRGGKVACLVFTPEIQQFQRKYCKI